MPLHISEVVYGNGSVCGCLAVKFDSCNNLLPSVHT